MKNVKILVIILLTVIAVLFLTNVSQENLLDSLLRFNKVATKQEIPISSKDEIPPSEITPSQIPNSRLEFGLMLESFKLKSMIEIGVQQGLFAKQMFPLISKK